MCDIKVLLPQSWNSTSNRTPYHQNGWLMNLQKEFLRLRVFVQLGVDIWNNVQLREDIVFEGGVLRHRHHLWEKDH